MKVTTWEKGSGREKEWGGTMVCLSRQDALRLVESIMTQMLAGDMDGSRWETFDEDGRYFSVSVDPSKCDYNCPNAARLWEEQEKALREKLGITEAW